MTRTRFGIVGRLILALTGASAPDAPRTCIYEVEAGAYERRDTPLMVRLPGGWHAALGIFLEDLDNDTCIPVQSAAYHVNGFFGISWIVRAPIPAGKTRRYRLSTGFHELSCSRRIDVRAFIDGKPGGVEFARFWTAALKVGERPFLTYQAGVNQPAAIERTWHDYAEPPKVTVIEEKP